MYQENTLRIRLAMFGENHPSVLKTYTRIADTLAAKGDEKKAFIYRQKALAVAQSLKEIED